MTTQAAERAPIARSERGQKYAALQERLTKTAESMGATIANSLTKDQLVQFMLGAVRKTPAILDCDPASVALAMHQIGTLGLRLGPLGHVYVVPYKKDLQVIVGYKGFIELALRSTLVAYVEAKVIYRQDDFRVAFGLNRDLQYSPGDHDCLDADIVGAYCLVKLKDGSSVFDFMRRREIEAVRKRSRAAGSGPWVSDYAAMCRKTVIRRLFSGGTVPMATELARVIDNEDAVDAAELGMIEDAPTHQITDTIDGANSPYIDAEPEREPARSESSGYGYMQTDTGPALASEADRNATADAMKARGWLGAAIKTHGPVSGWTDDDIAKMRAELAKLVPTEAKTPTTPPADDDGGAP